MNNILNGTMYITDNPEVIYNIPLNQPNIKIVNLDEDGVLMNNDVKCADVVITIYFEYADGDWVEVNDVLLDIDCYNGYSVSVSPNKYFNNGNDSGYCRRIITFLNSSGTHYEYYLYAYADCYGNVDFNTVINRVY